MIASMLAATFTFTASATGVAKGTPVEFLFTGQGSDRAYETMFELDMPVGDFAAAIEKAGLPRGRPLDPVKCVVWPVGTPVGIEPPISKFVYVDGSDGFAAAPFIYAGGTRRESGEPVAASEMPASVASFYTLDQSLFVPDGMHHQGDVYGKFLAAETLKKGTRYAFTLTWDEAASPRRLKYTIKSGESSGVLKALKAESAKGAVDVEVSFGGDMALSEAAAVAQALDTVDSVRVKLNGAADGSLFYRAFLPLVKWTDRQNRMVQPFEFTLDGDKERLVFVEEDWNVPGDDPKLTPREISFEEACKKESTDTCFIFAAPETRLERIYAAMGKLKGSKVRNWYVFATPQPSLHNPPYAK